MPGFVGTDWFRNAFGDEVFEQIAEGQRKGTPMGRAGGPDDIKGPIMFFASRASAHVTGQFLVVDAGMLLGMPFKVNGSVTMSAELKKQVCDIIDGMADELVDASHAIHAKPEIAFEEKFAHGLLTDKVEAAGLNVERHACGLDTAFISSFGDGDTEVGILSEYDALPGIGHACGHNIIATTGLGASLALAKLNGELPAKCAISAPR